MRVIYNGEFINEKKFNILAEPFRQNSGLIGIICRSSFDCILAVYILKVSTYSILIIPPYLPPDMIDVLLQDIQLTKLYTLENGKIVDCKEILGSHLELKSSSFLFVTSASTAYPKIVYKTKKQLDAEVERYIRKLNVTEEDVMFPAVSLYHNYGFVCGLLVAQAANATLILDEKPFPHKVVRRANEFGATILFSIPVFYKEMLHCHTPLTSNIRYLIVSCASMEDDLLNDFYTHFGHRLTQQYGATETGSLALSTESDSAGEFSDAMDGVFFREEKETGEIIISSGETLGNYIKENRIISLNSTYYHSGDKGSCQQNSLKITGRVDDVVNISGRKISLSFIQKRLLEIPEILGVSVFAVKRQNGTYIQCEYQKNHYSKKELESYCQTLLPTYCLPWLIHESASSHRWKETIEWKAGEENTYEHYGDNERKL